MADNSRLPDPSRRRFLRTLGWSGSLLALSRRLWRLAVPPAAEAGAAGGILRAPWPAGAAEAGRRPPPDATSWAALAEGFRTPPDSCRIMMRWWWFGPDVQDDELRRELETMRAGGIGGVEVNAVYPLTVDEPARGLVNLRYNSPEFLRRVRFAALTARRLQLRFDLTIGSGWPYGGPWIPEALAAGQLRMARVAASAGASQAQLPAAAPGDTLLGAFVVPTAAQSGAGVPVHLDAQGKATFAAAKEDRELLAFYAGHTRQRVKRAAFGAEGYVLDHYNRAALERHLAVLGDALLRAAGPKNVTTAFCDSLESYGANWTPALLDEFRRRRGYDLLPRLPDLAVERGAATRAVRHDFGQTLTELFNANFLQPYQHWCHARGVKARVQAYGIPPAAVSSYRYVDFPEGEGRPWNQLSMNRWASSASHHFGQPLASAETWTWIHSPVFRATPLDLKAGADQRFLAGINLLVGHGWPYSPPQAGEPGWHFYAAGALNAHNPWWPVMPDLARYLQRLSFLLRQGEPVADVLLYAPNHDAWAAMDWRNPFLNETIVRLLGPELVPAILNAGYGFDLIDDEILRDAQVADGALRVGKHTYRAMVLPAVRIMPPETLALLARFAAAGGSVIAARRLPDEVPGLTATPAQRQQLQALVAQMTERGQLVLVEEPGRVGEALRHRVPPAAVLDPAAPDIGFAHRRTPEAEVFFIANTGNQPYRGTVRLRAEAGAAAVELWDPLTGAATALPPGRWRREGQHVGFPLELAAYGSIVALARRLGAAAASHARPWRAWSPLKSIDLGRDWQVTFTGLKKTLAMATLGSWAAEPELRFYSGEAVYAKTVAVDAAMAGARRIVLDFGEGRPLAMPSGTNRDDPRNAARTWLEPPVREAAIVFVNGRRAGSVWCPPYQVEVTGLLRAGKNRIEVRVVNTALNELAGQPPPDLAAIYARFGRRFENQDLDRVRPLPSGLLGPVRLVAAA